MWYLKACRSCLTATGLLIRIDPATRRQFSAATGLEVTLGDGFPQYFCAECYTHIKKMIQFRRRSRRAYYVLKEIESQQKQISQRDIVRVNHLKTNLTSPYDYWKPEKSIAYSYATSENIFGIIPENNSPKMGKHKKSNTANETIKTINSGSTITISYYAKSTSQLLPTNGKFVKHNLDSINRSSILVNIKPANWKDIERVKEEEDGKIQDVVEFIEDNNLHNDSTCAADEEIDLEDVFKGLKEESEKESETDIEPEGDSMKENEKSPIASTTALNMFQKYLQPRDDITPIQEEIDKLINRFNRGAVNKALARVSIRFLSKEEQLHNYLKMLESDTFRNAQHKCTVCLTVYKTVPDLLEHLKSHVEKSSLEHKCDICKDVFATEEALEQHASLTHWYEYDCPNCKRKHYRLIQLIKCYERIKDEPSNDSDLKIEKFFKIGPQTPAEMTAPQMWTGRKNGSNRCYKCKISFLKKKDLAMHIKKHSPYPLKANKVYLKCDICSLLFPTKHQISLHMILWHNLNYTCYLCDTVVRNRQQAWDHLDKAHRQIYKQALNTCTVCSRVCEPGQFLNHMLTAHRMYCNMCDHHCSSRKALLMHQLTTHGLIRLNTVAELNDPRFCCVKCNIYFLSENILFAHLVREEHDEAGSYERGCMPCATLFDSRREYEDHHSECPHRETVYPRQCNNCRTRLVDWRQFHSHSLTCRVQPRAEDKRVCECCGKVVSRHYISQHMLKYHPEVVANITCRYCSSRSRSEVEHVLHVLHTHTREPYCCTICGYRSKSLARSRDHILKVHVPVRPYKCKECRCRFSHVDRLNEHSRLTHTSNVDVYKDTLHSMDGKIFVYPHLKIDGSMIELSILERVTVVRCDYMHKNSKTIQYNDAFFFDTTIDASKYIIAPKIDLNSNKNRTKVQQKRKRIRKPSRKTKETKIEDKAKTDHNFAEKEVKRLIPSIDFKVIPTSKKTELIDAVKNKDYNLIRDKLKLQQKKIILIKGPGKPTKTKKVRHTVENKPYRFIEDAVLEDEANTSKTLIDTEETTSEAKLETGVKETDREKAEYINVADNKIEIDNEADNEIKIEFEEENEEMCVNIADEIDIHGKTSDFQKERKLTENEYEEATISETDHDFEGEEVPYGFSEDTDAKVEMEIEKAEYLNVFENEDDNIDNIEIEEEKEVTDGLVGQVIEENGERFVLVDGALFKLEFQNEN